MEAIIVGLLYFSMPYWAIALDPYVERIFYWILRGAFIFFIVCSLFHTSKILITRDSLILRRLTDVVYSFYMFHFLIIYIIANLMLNLTDNLYLIFAAILLAGFPILVAIHEKIIARSPLLMLLFNGKIVRRAVPA